MSLHAARLGLSGGKSACAGIGDVVGPIGRLRRLARNPARPVGAVARGDQVPRVALESLARRRLARRVRRARARSSSPRRLLARRSAPSRDARPRCRPGRSAPAARRVPAAELRLDAGPERAETARRRRSAAINVPGSRPGRVEPAATCDPGRGASRVARARPLSRALAFSRSRVCRRAGPAPLAARDRRIQLALEHVQAQRAARSATRVVLASRAQRRSGSWTVAGQPSCASDSLRFSSMSRPCTATSTGFW